MILLLRQSGPDWRVAIGDEVKQMENNAESAVMWAEQKEGDAFPRVVWEVVSLQMLMEFQDGIRRNNNVIIVSKLRRNVFRRNNDVIHSQTTSPVPSYPLRHPRTGVGPTHLWLLAD